MLDAGAARPRPRLSPDNRPFWEACRKCLLVLPTCLECGRAHLPPGPVCPYCLGEGLEWCEATGRGRLASWVVVHKAWFEAFAAEVPYTVALVELEEGPRLTAALRGAVPGELALGLAVRVGFERVDPDLTLPFFTPRERGQGGPGTGFP